MICIKSLISFSLTYPNRLSVNDGVKINMTKHNNKGKNILQLLKDISALGNFQFDDSIWRTMNLGRPHRKSNKRLYTKNSQKPFTCTMIMTRDCEEQEESIELVQ